MKILNDVLCVRSDLPAYSCSHCRGLPWDAPAIDSELDPFAMAAPPAGKPGAGSWFTASLPGSCSACGGDIIPGDTIRADGHGEYECSCVAPKGGAR